MGETDLWRVDDLGMEESVDAKDIQRAGTWVRSGPAGLPVAGDCRPSRAAQAARYRDVRSQGATLPRHRRGRRCHRTGTAPDTRGGKFFTGTRFHDRWYGDHE